MNTAPSPIFVGVGANLPTAGFASPRETCGAALDRLAGSGNVMILDCSSWYESAPVPISDQPWFVNAVVSVLTTLSPDALMARLLAIESEFGRQRSVKNAPRILDLDLLVYGDQVLAVDPVVPHPRMHVRAFTVLPICELAPDWVHPVMGVGIAELRTQLPADQDIQIMARANGFLGTEWTVGKGISSHG